MAKRRIPEDEVENLIQSIWVFFDDQEDPDGELDSLLMELDEAPENNLELGELFQKISDVLKRMNNSDATGLQVEVDAMVRRLRD